MLFLNPEILKNCDDVKIGSIRISQESISYLSYIEAVKLRILKLVIQFVKFDMSEGASHEQSIKDCLQLIHSTLNFQLKEDRVDEEGLVEEIVNSEEFKDWSTEVKYRFLNTHRGVVQIDTPIKVNYQNKNFNVMQETIDYVSSEDSLQVVLDGLAAINYLD